MDNSWGKHSLKLKKQISLHQNCVRHPLNLFEFEYSLIKRTYQLNKNQYLESEIKRDVQWVDYHLIYDVWNSYPTWKELRRAYERTWWFHKTKQQKRDFETFAVFRKYYK